MELNRGPLARSEDLIVEELGDEVLIYDSRIDKGHCLSPDAARVWRRCDGKTPLEGLVAQLGLTSERVESALDELDRCDLLEGEGDTRRELGIKVVKAGAAVAATPLIVSVLAPTPAMATTLAACLVFSRDDCGNAAGCGSIPGCCCCTPVLNRPFPPGGPCDQNAPAADQQCKTCVTCVNDAALCKFYGHGNNSSCSNRTNC